MTTIDTRPDTAVTEDDASNNALVSFVTTAAAWSVTTDHKRIGRMYVGAGLLGLMASAVVGVLLGLERADDAALLDSDALLQTFQAYRVGLVFATLAPLALGLAIAVVPMQLGARSIAFPRLALVGFYAWFGGLVLTMASLGANGGIGGGDADAIALFIAAHGLMILGLLAGAGSVATSVLTTRAPGMTMRRVPLTAWSALVTAIGMLLALPVMFGAIIYLFVDFRNSQLNFGGSEGIGVWIGWAFSVPTVIIFAVVAAGLLAELVAVTFRAAPALRGPVFAGIALIGVAAFAAVTQQFVHDVTFDTTGRDFFEGVVPTALFAGLPVLGVVMVFGLLAATAKNGMADGRPQVNAPFVFAFLGLGMAAVGIVGNLLLSINDLELAGTVFEEGATLYVVYGTALAVMGGVVFWSPKLWGRTVGDKQVMPLALLGTIATVLAALPLYVAGFLDQVGGIPVNDAAVEAQLALDSVEGGELWTILSLAGHGLMALTVLGFVGLLLKTGSGDDADDNPYGGQTIEWATSSPAPAHNFDHVPTVASATPQLDLNSEGSQS